MAYFHVDGRKQNVSSSNDEEDGTPTSRSVIINGGSTWGKKRSSIAPVSRGGLIR